MAAQEGYVDISIIVDGVDAFAETYGEGEELAAEAFREGIVKLGKCVTNDVEMFVQYHPHSTEVTECICAQYEDHGYRWSNARADKA